MSIRYYLPLCMVLMAALITGCSGGNQAGSQQQPPPAMVNPTAAFSAPVTATVLDAVALDASASTSGDGSPLQYVWEFDGGERGGGVRIAHVFAAAGEATVKLTVIDGAGRISTLSKSITISALSTPVTPVTAQILVRGLDGTAIDGVSVSPAGAATGSTDSSGKITVTLNAGSSTTLKFSKAGYCDQFFNIALPAGAGSDGYFEVTLRARDAPLTLADATAGGTLTGRDGATITVAADAFIDSSGTPVTGAVQISITPVDVTQAGAGGFPGGFEGIQADGTKTPIVSAGVNEFVPTANGAPVQLAPGQTASITIPIYAAKKLDGTLIAAGDVIPLWSLDEATGVWIQEGTGTVVASSDSPSGLALSAVVTHLSWWNCDFGFFPYGPKPKCVPDVDPTSDDPFLNTTLCDVFAALNNGAGSSGSRIHASPRVSSHSAPADTILVPREVAFYREYGVPIAGGQSIGVPADTDVLLTAYAVNGTWTGTATVHGAGGVEDEVTVTLHRVGQASSTPEAITLPFDDSRSVAAASTAQFTFTAPAGSVVRVKIAPNSGSFFTGTLRLLQGTTLIGTATISNGELEQVVAYLSAAGTYTIAADIDRAAAFRLQVDLEPSDAGVQPLTLPFNSERSLLPNASADFSFSGVANQYVRVVVATPPDGSGGQASLSGEVQLLLNGTVIASATLSGATTQLLVPITEAGTYTIRITGSAGASFQLAADLEGAAQTEALSLPTDITRSIPAEGVYRGTLTLTAPTTIFLDSRNLNGDLTDVKLLNPDGSVLFDAPPSSPESDTTNSFVGTLQPGTYTVQVSPQNAMAATERLTLAATSWVPVAPALPVNGLRQTVDLVIDRQGKPVAGFIDPASSTQSSHVLKLRRWTGTAWETVAADLVLGSACERTDGASFAFDGSNNPVVVYANSSATDGSTFFSAYRWNGSAWAAVGANEGRLPFTAASNVVCDYQSTTLVGADDQPVVAYPSPNGAVVLHFDGSSWVGFATPTGDLFGDFSTTYFEARFDPAGKLWLVTGSDAGNASGSARRLNTSTNTWEAVGGSFPQIGTLGLQQPRLRFDSAGSPVVAFLADVGANDASHGGVAVYRFNGTDWQTSGGHDASPTSSGAGVPDPGFVMFNDQAVLTWDTSLDVTQDPPVSTVVAQINTAGGWAPIGSSIGELAQYSQTGASQALASDDHLATDGNEVYLSVIAVPDGLNTGIQGTVLMLLKRTGN